MNEQTAIFAAGCFWGVQHVFQAIDGVIASRVGYIGGHKESPTYNEVCSSDTGHAEAVEIIFDADVISFNDLLSAFWQCHNPTLVNRQGPDIGSQYRSAIFYLTNEQQQQARESRELAQHAFGPPIATEITAASHFYPAEEYHQDYFKKHPNAACHISFDHPEN